MGPFDIWSQLQALQPPNQYGQPQPAPGSPAPAVMRQEGLDGGHGNDGNRGRRPGPPSKPRWREMDWGDRLSALGAIVGDLDPRMQGRGMAAFREEYAGRGQADLARQQAQAQLERQQAFRDAYAASLDENGNLDPAKLQRNLAPFIDDFGDIGALNSATNRPKPARYNMNGTLVEEGDDGQFRPTFGLPYVPGPEGSWVANPNAPQRPQAPNGPPAVGARVVNPNDPNAPAMVWNGSAWTPETSPRPTSAAPVRAATPQGQGFGNYSDLRGFVSQQVPGARFTSGYRTQAEQDDLVRRGKTRATRSQHTYGMGQDIVPPVPMSQWPEIARQLEATGRFRTVLIETGKGRNQGTAPHIHLEPR